MTRRQVVRRAAARIIRCKRWRRDGSGPFPGPSCDDVLEEHARDQRHWQELADQAGRLANEVWARHRDGGGSPTASP